jgi:hypothetical protein
MYGLTYHACFLCRPQTSCVWWLIRVLSDYPGVPASEHLCVTNNDAATEGMSSIAMLFSSLPEASSAFSVGGLVA